MRSCIRISTLDVCGPLGFMNCVAWNFAPTFFFWRGSRNSFVPAKGDRTPDPGPPVRITLSPQARPFPALARVKAVLFLYAPAARAPVIPLSIVPRLIVAVPGACLTILPGRLGPL